MDFVIFFLPFNWPHVILLLNYSSNNLTAFFPQTICSLILSLPSWIYAMAYYELMLKMSTLFSLLLVFDLVSTPPCSSFASSHSLGSRLFTGLWSCAGSSCNPTMWIQDNDITIKLEPPINCTHNAIWILPFKTIKVMLNHLSKNNCLKSAIAQKPALSTVSKTVV